MPRSIIGPKAVQAFIAQGPALASNLQALQMAAETAGVYFWADLTLTYSQQFDVDSGRGIGAEADAPALEGAVDVGAQAGISVTKSREGELSTTQTMRFRSKVALEEDRQS